MDPVLAAGSFFVYFVKNDNNKPQIMDVQRALTFVKWSFYGGKVEHLVIPLIGEVMLDTGECDKRKGK